MVFTKVNLDQSDMLLSKLKKISAGIDCKIPYGRTMMHVLVKPGLQYQKADNEIIRKSLWKVQDKQMKYKCLINVHKYHEDGYLIIYLDKTSFVSHDLVRMLWSDRRKSSSLSETPLRGKRLVKCNARKSKGFLEYSLLICGK